MHVKRNKESIWNCWKTKYNPDVDGFLSHAFDEKECREKEEWKTLCGIIPDDGGFLKLGEDRWYPSCIKCQRILSKSGLLKDNI